MREGLGEACQDKRPWAGMDSRVWASALALGVLAQCRGQAGEFGTPTPGH